MCHGKSINQHHVSGQIPGTEKQEPGIPMSLQNGIGEEEKGQVSLRRRGLFTKSSLPLAGQSTLYKTSHITKLIWFRGQPTWHFLHIYWPFCIFFRPWPLKRKTRRGGQCRRGLQRPDLDKITESLESPHHHILDTSGYLMHKRPAKGQAQFFCTFGAFPNQHVYPPRDTRVSPPEQTIWIIAALTCGHSCLSLTI
ncbi:uncharacterized protein [Dendrobates tinctorius]|uniref:uncharacterized protein isoform X3 n=1 Tax=Dendrobates tinctorius TaxID=92724 RepID=UPI003CC96BB0